MKLSKNVEENCLFTINFIHRLFLWLYLVCWRDAPGLGDGWKCKRRSNLFFLLLLIMSFRILSYTYRIEFGFTILDYLLITLEYTGQKIELQREHVWIQGDRKYCFFTPDWQVTIYQCKVQSRFGNYRLGKILKKVKKKKRFRKMFASNLHEAFFANSYLWLILHLHLVKIFLQFRLSE